MSSAIYQKNWQAYLLLLPTILACLVFTYFPALDTFRLAVYRTIAPGAPATYVGMDNFVRLLTSSDYQYTIWLTFAFVVVVVVGSMIASLYFGYLVYKIDRGKPIYLVGAITSYSLSFAVVAMIFLFLLHPSVGIVTYFLGEVFGIEFNWFQNSWMAFVVVTVTTMWKLIGFNVVFVVGALGGIPDTLNETARLAGVGNIKMLTKVYIPLISPTLAFLVIMNTIYAFFLPFPVIDLMTSGGPGNATSVLIYQLWQDAFEFNRTGLAAAQSILLFIIVGALMLVQLLLSDRLAHYKGDD